MPLLCLVQHFGQPGECLFELDWVFDGLSDFIAEHFAEAAAQAENLEAHGCMESNRSPRFVRVKGERNCSRTRLIKSRAQDARQIVSGSR